MKVCLVGHEFFRSDGRTEETDSQRDGHDEVNSCFSEYREIA